MDSNNDPTGQPMPQNDPHDQHMIDAAQHSLYTNHDGKANAPQPFGGGKIQAAANPNAPDPDTCAVLSPLERKKAGCPA